MMSAVGTRQNASDLHYSDGSHRWVPPRPDMSVHGWRAQVRAHVEDAAKAGGCDLLPRPQAQARRPASQTEGEP